MTPISSLGRFAATLARVRNALLVMLLALYLTHLFGANITLVSGEAFVSITAPDAGTLLALMVGVVVLEAVVLLIVTAGVHRRIVARERNLA